MQLFDALEHLDQVVDEVFGRIEDKVALERDNLIAVNDRINVAKAKVDKIVGSRKATQVFSSAKYPAPDALDAFVPVFQTADPLDMRPAHYRIDETIVQ